MVLLSSRLRLASQSQDFNEKRVELPLTATAIRKAINNSRLFMIAPFNVSVAFMDY